MKGYLVLESGRVFQGKLLNDCRMAGGEVVFSTAMISYQDIITDPSYYGQIVVMTPCFRPILPAECVRCNC